MLFINAYIFSLGAIESEVFAAVKSIAIANHGAAGESAITAGEESTETS